MCGSEPKKNLRSFLFKVYPYFIHPVQKSRTKLDIHLNITLQQKHEKATTTIAGSVQCYSCLENFVEKKQKKILTYKNYNNYKIVHSQTIAVKGTSLQKAVQKKSGKQTKRPYPRQ